jgi:hypothetical protein
LRRSPAATDMTAKSVAMLPRLFGPVGAQPDSRALLLTVLVKPQAQKLLSFHVELLNPYVVPRLNQW